MYDDDYDYERSKLDGERDELLDELEKVENKISDLHELADIRPLSYNLEDKLKDLEEWREELEDDLEELENRLEELEDTGDYYVRKQPLPELVVPKGTDVNAKLAGGMALLHWAVYNKRNVNELKSLISQGADVNVKDLYGKTPLHIAAERNSEVEILKYLISQGADVNMKDNEGKMPFDLALEKGSFVKILEFLVPQRSYVNGQLLHKAIQNNCPVEILEIIVSQGVDVNSLGERDWTPLHKAVHKKSNVEIIECLVSHGANFNAKDDNDETPLHWAAAFSDTMGILKYLVSIGANVNIKNKQGKTPLDIANTEEKKHILREAMELSNSITFYVNTLKGKCGPFTLPQLKAFAQDGKLRENNPVSIGDTEKWVKAKTIPGLFLENNTILPPVSQNKEQPKESLPMNDSFAKLSEKQKEAVTTTEGYIRVVAGAGSGKTNALTHRYAYLVNTVGIPASDILCVTFTNKAAAEMKKRIRRMIGDFGTGRISTFHGFCVQLLKEDCHVLQYPPNFLILDEEDASSMIELCFEKLGITSQQFTVQQAKEAIGRYKHGPGHTHSYCKLLADSQMPTLLESHNNASTLEEKIIFEYLYEQRKSFALDFTDLIIFALHILRHDEKVREKWQQRLQYIMVDEFQDVDSDQYELARILSDYHKNLFVVGDPDQMIYSWRGAKVEYFLEFPYDKEIIMDVNYRSLAKIISASNSLIRKNKKRIEKNLFPHRTETGRAIYFHAKTQKEEAEWIVKQIEAIKEHGVSLSKIVILYRAHFVSRPIEEALRNRRLHYTILKGVGFYQRKEVKDVLSYLRLIHSDDDLSFLRIVNKPERGIGKKRLEFLRDYTERHNCSYLSALSKNINDPIFEKTDATVFLELINKYRKTHKKYSLTDLLNAILTESGYEEYLRTIGDEERLEILVELRQSIYEYETTAGEETNLESYLHDIALYTDADKDDDTDSIKLMTVHSAKGLEFPYVFVCGMNEGIFPSSKSNTPEKIEEERRLAYVAFTRAEDTLFLSDAEGMNLDSSFRYPSRFIFDTEQVHLDYVVPLPPHLIGQTVASRSTAYTTHSIFSVGTKIVHDVFGKGEILSIDSEESHYLISFENISSPRKISFGITLKKLEASDDIPF